jgi:5-methyltetrahydropteroyltriglutamate--homocysteine methyltransferase
MSIDRIVTTHVGSLPRGEAVTDLLFAQERGDSVEPQAAEQILGTAVEQVVARQRHAGIDIISDGEMSKISYATYIKERISGFDGDSPRTPPADLEQYPTFLKRQAKGGGTPSYRRPRCEGPIAPLTMEPLRADIKRFKSAAGASGGDLFMNSASPGVIALFHPNDHYPRQSEYLEALAEAMRPEYEAIVDAGLILQIDSPDLGLGRHMMFKDKSDDEYLFCIAQHVEVLNHSLRNVPAERVRMHVCWGNYEGPHHCDVEMGVILPVLMKARPASLLFETSNPRHQHDWEAFVEHRRAIPDDKVLVPGVIDSTTNFIEHPRVVANRILTFTNLFGRERVIAGTDCGFSTFAGFGAVDPEIVWAKLQSLSEGAAIASDVLWSRAA